MYGLGFALQSDLPACSSLTLPAGFVGPVECDASAGGPVYTAAGASLDDLAGLPSNAPAGAANPMAWPWLSALARGSAGGSSFSEWLNRNYQTVGLGVLAAVLVVSIAKGGRR